MTRIAGIPIMLAALIVAAISTAQAQEEKTVMGPLGFSCGKWTNAAKRPTSTEHQVLKQWVLGFISGINFETSGDFLRDRDADGLIAWVDNYCRTNPLHNMPQTMVELVKVLRAGR
jgi:hypothetical protein